MLIYVHLKLFNGDQNFVFIIETKEKNKSSNFFIIFLFHINKSI